MTLFQQQLIDAAIAANKAATSTITPVPTATPLSPGSYNSNLPPTTTNPTPSPVTPINVMNAVPSSAVVENPTTSSGAATIAVGSGITDASSSSTPKTNTFPMWIVYVLAVLLIFLLYKYGKK